MPGRWPAWPASRLRAAPTPRKQIIYAEGNEANRVYFVQSGRVKTIRSTNTGKGLITNIYQAGEFFGYPALLELTPRTLQVLQPDKLRRNNW
jgi:CRP-like cAMP-binding protein